MAAGNQAEYKVKLAVDLNQFNSQMTKANKNLKEFIGHLSALKKQSATLPNINVTLRKGKTTGATGSTSGGGNGNGAGAPAAAANANTGATDQNTSAEQQNTNATNLNTKAQEKAAQALEQMNRSLESIVKMKGTGPFATMKGQRVDDFMKQLAHSAGMNPNSAMYKALWYQIMNAQKSDMDVLRKNVQDTMAQSMQQVRSIILPGWSLPNARRTGGPMTYAAMSAASSRLALPPGGPVPGGQSVIPYVPQGQYGQTIDMINAGGTYVPNYRGRRRGKTAKPAEAQQALGWMARMDAVAKRLATSETNQVMRGYYRLRDFGRQITGTGYGMTFGFTMPYALAMGATAKVAGDYQMQEAYLRANIAGSKGDLYSGSTNAAIAALGARAQGGFQTMFSPKEILAAETEMIRYGMTVEQVSGTIEEFAQMAQLEGMSLADATYIGSTAMFAFERKVDDVNAVVATLTQASKDSALTVMEMGHNLAMAGESAHVAGWSFESTLAAMSAMSRQGIAKERIGTYMRGIADSMQDIYSDKNMQTYSRVYGLNIVGKNGMIKDISDITDQFVNMEQKIGYKKNGEISKYGWGQYMKVMDSILPREQRNAMFALMKASASVEGDWVDPSTKKAYKNGDVVKAGAYQRYLSDRMLKAQNGGQSVQDWMSSTAMGNMNMSLAELNVTIQQLLIAVGNAGLLDGITKLAKGLKRVVEGMTGFVKANPKMTMGIIGLGGAAAVLGPLTIALGGVATGLFNARIGSIVLGPVVTKLAGSLLLATANGSLFLGIIGALLDPLNAVIAAVAVLAGGMLVLAATDSKYAKQLGDMAAAWDWLLGPLIKIGQGVMDVTGRIIGGIVQILTAPLGLIIRVITDIVGLIGDVGGMLIDLFTGNADDLRKRTANIVGWVQRLVSDITYELVNLAHGILVVLTVGLWDYIWGYLTKAVHWLVAPFEWLYDTLVGHSIVPDMVNAIVDWFLWLPKVLVSSLRSLVRVVVTPFKALFDVLSFIFNPKTIGGIWRNPKIIADVIGKALGAVWSMISDNEFVKFIGNMLGGEGVDFSGFLDPGKIASALSGVFSGVLGIMGNNPVFNVLNALFGKINVGNVLGGMVDFAMNAAGDFGSILGGVFDTIWKVVTDNPFLRVIEAIFYPQGLDFDKIAQGLYDGFMSIATAMQTAIGLLIDTIKQIPGMQGLIDFLGNMLRFVDLGKNGALYDSFMGFFDDLKQAIGNFVADVVGKIPFFDKVLSFMQTVMSAGGGVWSAGVAAVSNATGWFKNPNQDKIDAANTQLKAFYGLAKAASLFGDMGPIMAYRAIYNAIIGWGGTPSMPALAMGGIVTGPTMAMIGESGPEVVVPLSEAGSYGIGQTGPVTITIEMDGEVLARKTLPAITENIRIRGI